jgi:hypothetical protein
MMAVRAVGKLGVHCPQMSLNRHAGRGIGGNQPEICLQLAFHAFKFGCGLLPDAIMVLIVISTADLPDTSPLLLLGCDLGQIVPQAFRHAITWRDFPDGTLKRAAPPVQLGCRQCVYRVLCRLHIPSLCFAFAW